FKLSDPLIPLRLILLTSPSSLTGEPCLPLSFKWTCPISPLSALSGKMIPFSASKTSHLISSFLLLFLSQLRHQTSQFYQFLSHLVPASRFLVVIPFWLR